MVSIRYYKKLLASFLSIALIYTLLINITFISWYRISSQDTIDRSIDAAASRAGEYVDFQLQSVKEISHLLRISEYTRKYLIEDPEEPDRYSRLRLNKFLSSIYGVAPSQKNGIAITKILDDYAITQSSSGTLDHALQEFCLNREALQLAVDAFEEEFNLPLVILASSSPDGQRYFTVICREWLGQKNPLYILVSYREEQLLPVRDTGASFLILYNGVPIASAGPSGAEEILELASEKAGGGRGVRSLPSSVSGFTYLYLAPETSSSAASFILLSLAGITLMLLSFLAMLLLAKRMYSPIAETLRGSGISLTSGNEFAEISKAFRSLSSSVSQYHAALENKFFHDLFTGLAAPDQIGEQLRQFGAPQGGAPFTAVLIRYMESDESGLKLPDNLIYETRRRLTLDLCDHPGQLRVYRIIDLNFSTQGLIVQTDDRDTFIEQLRAILLREEPEFGLDIAAYLGEPVAGLADIQHSYRQAARLMAQSEFSTVKERIVSGTPKNEARETAYYPLNLEQNLISAVIHGRTTVWQTLLREITDANQTPDKLAQLAFMLTSTVNRIIDGVHETARDFFPDGTIVYLEFRACGSPESFFETACHIFGSIEAHLAQKERQSAQSLKQRMTDYLQQNYMRDISLLDLAEFLNMSKNYVSTLFKNLTGRNFKDALSELRYEKACEALRRRPDSKLRDVAESVGCNPEILHRLFLRYGGVTPSDFQKQCQSGQEQP